MTVFKNIAFPLKNDKFDRDVPYVREKTENKFKDTWFSIYDKVFYTRYLKHHYSQKRNQRKNGTYCLYPWTDSLSETLAE